MYYFMNIDSFAKVNLFLDFLYKREDNFHEISSILHEVSLKDKLVIKETSEPIIKISSSASFLPTDESNICFKIIDFVKKEFGIEQGINLFIEKNIPVAGGLAGGSSNGVYLLKGLNDLWNLSLSPKDMVDIVSRFGSDTAFFVYGNTAVCKGRGEIVEPISFSHKLFFVFVSPNVITPPNKTKWIFSNYDVSSALHKPISSFLSLIDSFSDSNEIIGSMFNTFHSLSLPEYNKVFSLLDLMKTQGSLNPLISGAGPTCFATFDSKSEALSFNSSFSNEFNSFFCSSKNK